jgi:hypothetical protein
MCVCGEGSHSYGYRKGGEQPAFWSSRRAGKGGQAGGDAKWPKLSEELMENFPDLLSTHEAENPNMIPEHETARWGTEGVSLKLSVIQGTRTPVASLSLLSYLNSCPEQKVPWFGLRLI